MAGGITGQTGSQGYESPWVGRGVGCCLEAVLVSATALPTVTECVENTVRLLRNAEMETDRSQQPNMTAVAGIWLDLAVFLDDRETMGDD